jgi:hypothetical protein
VAEVVVAVGVSTYSSLPDRDHPSQKAWDWGIVLLVFVMFAALAALPAYLIPFQVPRNANEGWNAYYALAAMGGGELYPPADAFIVNNYPPLSFYVVGAFGRLVGDYVVAGRLISSVSLLVVAGNVFALCRWVGADRMLAALGSGLFLVAFCSLTFDYIAMDDPQLLAHAFITSGAVIFLRDATGRGRFLKILLSAFLMLAGGLIKHNLVALPLAVCTFAAIHDRRKLAEFLFVAFVLGALALWTVYLRWGQAIVVGVLEHARILSIERIARFSARAMPTVSPYFILTAFACAAYWRRREFHFVLAYTVWSALAGFLPMAGMGTNLNLLYDFAIAVVIGSVGCVMAFTDPKICGPSGRRLSRRTAFVILALPLIVRGAVAADRHVGEYWNLMRDAGEWTELIHVVASTDQPVACDMLVICFWAGKPQEIDFFNYGQRLYAGRLSDHAFRDRISEGYYRYILLDRDDSSKGLEFAKRMLGIDSEQGPLGQDKSAPFSPKASLPSETMAWLLSRYEPSRTIGPDSVLFVPRSVR